MTEKQCLVQRTVEEYEAVFGKSRQGGALGRDEIGLRLERELAWTHDGAQAIAGLAQEYGAFMLRNALAVATVLGIEDGELGL